ncbi:MAG: serine/threonine-protein kinase [Gemmatimonadota bacterium]
MDRLGWERIQALFHAAAEVPVEAQRAFLHERCDDAALIDEVLALLAEDAGPATLLDRGVAEAAHSVIGAPDPAVLNREFGAYRITEVLGEGGMGVVYLAERADLGSRAAIKILRDAWLSPARRERFSVEQRTLAQLNHPAIARLYDADTLPDGTPWFVMEHVEGVPITEFCRQRASTIPERLRRFRDVCEAVQHAHLHLVIHRDLKPSNVLVRADGSVKLLDFGIAKQLDDFDSAVDQTRTSLRLMTPAYAAPEQVRGERVGVHTDVYSLGVMLYELLVGRLPFDLSGRSPAEAESIILQHEPEKPGAAARRMAATFGGTSHIRATSNAQWADLDVLILTAMQKDPQRRYRTVDALIRDIDRYLGGQPLEARPDSARYRIGKFVRRNWRPLSATAVLVTMIVGLVAFYTVRLSAARNTAVAEATRAQRIQRFTLNLLSGGDPESGPADSLRVVTLVDRGVQEARSLDADPVVQTELLQTLGGIYQQLGKLDRADSLLQVALVSRVERVGNDHPDVAANLVALGLLRSDQARYQEAERSIRQAMGIQQRHLPLDHPAHIVALEALGHVLEERGEYAQAIAVFDSAVHLRSRAGTESPEFAASLYELANVQFYAGNLAASDSLNRRVLAIHQRNYGERHPGVADVLINLGAIQHEQGKYVEAEKYYRRALDITRAWYGADSHATAANVTMLARSLVFQNRLEESEALLKEALAIRERVYGLVHPQVASTVNELGSIALRREKYADAEAAYHRMIDIYQKTYDGKHYLIGIAVSNLASVYMARRQYAEAEPLFRRAIDLYIETQSAAHINVGIARIKLGRTLLRQSRFAAAEKETRAGYEIVSRQADAGVSWLKSAREDLIIAYDSLGRNQDAQKFRTELASLKASK